MFKKLASQKPAADTLTVLYVAPAGQGVVCSLFITATAADTVHVYLAKNGEPNGADSNLIIYSDVSEKQTTQITSLALGNQDRIEVKSQNGNVVFTLVGLEGT